MTAVCRHARWRVWGALAGAAALFVGAVVGVVWWIGRDQPEPAPDQTVHELAAPDPGWRYESYRDVVVQVPDSWGYGWAPGPDRCASDGEGSPHPADPYVDVMGLTSGPRLILCTGSGGDPLGGQAPERLWATHLSFVDADDPAGQLQDSVTDQDGWTLIVASVGHVRLTVLADQDHLADAHRIVDSAQVVATDHDGCDVASPIQDGLFPRPPSPFDLTSIENVDAMAVCQYHLRTGSDRPGLLASRLLEGSAATAVLGALQGTTIGHGPDTPDTCEPAESQDTAIVLRLDPGLEQHDIYVYYDACVHNGFDDGTNLRRLTIENCAPLWGERVVQWSGSSKPFERCHPDL